MSRRTNLCLSAHLSAHFLMYSYPKKCYHQVTDPNSTLHKGHDEEMQLSPICLTMLSSGKRHCIHTKNFCLKLQILKEQKEHMKHTWIKAPVFDIHVLSAHILNPHHFLITQSTNQAAFFVMQILPEEDFKWHHWLSKAITWLICYFRLLVFMDLTYNMLLPYNIHVKLNNRRAILLLFNSHHENCRKYNLR